MPGQWTVNAFAAITATLERVFVTIPSSDQEGPQYVHLTVNHNKGYVDYKTGAHTQNIVRLWRDFKQKKKMQYGIFRRYVDSYCNEFVWRRNTLQRGEDIFEATLELVSRCAWDEVSYFP